MLGMSSQFDPHICHLNLSLMSIILIYRSLHLPLHKLDLLDESARKGLLNSFARQILSNSKLPRLRTITPALPYTNHMLTEAIRGHPTLSIPSRSPNGPIFGGTVALTGPQSLLPALLIDPKTDMSIYMTQNVSARDLTEYKESTDPVEELGRYTIRPPFSQRINVRSLYHDTERDWLSRVFENSRALRISNLDVFVIGWPIKSRKKSVENALLAIHQMCTICRPWRIQFCLSEACYDDSIDFKAATPDVQPVPLPPKLQLFLNKYGRDCGALILGFVLQRPRPRWQWGVIVGGVEWWNDFAVQSLFVHFCDTNREDTRAMGTFLDALATNFSCLRSLRLRFPASGPGRWDHALVFLIMFPA